MLDPVVVTAANGTLDTVVVTNPEGREVTGALSGDGTTWSSAEPLGYGRTYTITAVAPGLRWAGDHQFLVVHHGDPGRGDLPVVRTTTGPRPGRCRATHLGDLRQPPPDKAAAERALTVTTVPAQVGGWYWVDDRTVHYRPQVYWQAGTQVTVDAKVYGVDLGGGMYGETDRTLNLTIGQSKIATIDDATKQMIVTIDGQVVRQYPGQHGPRRVDHRGRSGDLLRHAERHLRGAGEVRRSSR